MRIVYAGFVAGIGLIALACAGAPAPTERLASAQAAVRAAKEVGAKVTPGKAALMLLIRSATAERVVAEMKKENLGGELMQSNLSTEDEEKLKAGEVWVEYVNFYPGREAKEPKQ